MNDDEAADSRAERARIGELLATHGADVSRWPEEHRPAPAQLGHLLAGDAALAAAFAREHALDAALRAADVAAADDLRTHRLQQRILASLPPRQPDHGSHRDHGGTLEPGSAAPATLAARATSHAPRRVRAALGPALAALVPLLIGFGAGMSGAGAGSTAGLPPASPTASEQAALAGAESGYADEATMAPFLVAANIDAMAREWQP